MDSELNIIKSISSITNTTNLESERSLMRVHTAEKWRWMVSIILCMLQLSQSYCDIQKVRTQCVNLFRSDIKSNGSVV